MNAEEIVQPTDEQVATDGPRLHYLDWGKHGRPPLLFLHGRRLTAHTCDLLCPAPRRDFPRLI
jgi:pimeloyl-ACP methyl ester carboxylesterase